MKKFFCILALFSSTATYSMLPSKAAPCSDEKTALMAAILCRNYISEPFINEQLSTINAQDACKRTALHYAALYNDKITIALLVQHGADRSLKDQDGKTAEDLASEQQKIIARSESHSYEHHRYQEPLSPDTDDVSKITIALIHSPGSAIILNKERTSQDSPHTRAQHTFRYTDYVSLM